MATKLRLRCQKPPHRGNFIQFVCLNPDCSQLRSGCFLCFPDHDGHTRQNIELETFYERVAQKEKRLENDYQQLVNVNVVRKYKDTLIRSLQSQFKSLTSKLFNFLDHQIEQLVAHIQHKNLSELQSQYRVRAYHDELERIRSKPAHSFENKDIDFLLQFLLDDEYDQMLDQALQQKEKTMNEFQYDMNQIPVQFEFQFSSLITQLDQWVLQTLTVDGRSEAAQQKSKSPTKAGKSPMNHSTNANNLSNSKSPMRTPSSKKRSFTPDTGSKRKAQKNYANPQTQQHTQAPQEQGQKLLYTVPEKNQEEFIQSDKDLSLFVQYMELNFIKEEFLNEHLGFLKQWHPDIFDMGKVTAKDKIALVNDHRTRLLYVLWENYMVEWLKPCFQQLPQLIAIKVHEVEENFNSFNELFDKSLKIHDIVVWLVKQRLTRPKTDYMSWLLLGQRSTKQYRMYSLKSAHKRQFRDSLAEEPQTVEPKIQKQSQLPRILQENLEGDFQINRDLKIVVKGLHDPNFQTYLLAERLQIFLNLVTNPQVAINLTFQQLEKHFDQVLVNFKSFVSYLHLSFKELQ